MFEACPCASGKTYIACCGPLHNGANAGSAEALMRARYSAFAKHDKAYLLRSWAPETRPLGLTLNAEQTWTGLSVESHQMTGLNSAEVIFTAHYKLGTKQGALRERSRFRKERGAWVYIDGVTA